MILDVVILTFVEIHVYFGPKRFNVVCMCKMVSFLSLRKRFVAGIRYVDKASLYWIKMFKISPFEAKTFLFVNVGKS